MLLDDVAARLAAEIPELARRVEGAAELAELVEKKLLPQTTPFAYVLPLGFRGGAPDAAAGLYRQLLDETVGVVLVVRTAGDATGRKTLPKVHELRDQVVQALAGWAPAGAFGVLAPSRGALVSLTAGAVIYQVDFRIDSLLRITR